MVAFVLPFLDAKLLKLSNFKKLLIVRGVFEDWLMGFNEADNKENVGFYVPLICSRWRRQIGVILELKVYFLSLSKFESI